MPPLDPVPDEIPAEEFQRAADRIPLLHVSDRPPRPTLPELIEQGEIPTSEEEHNYCGANARFVEEQLGHPPCVYFYVGRAHPNYGRVALAFSADTGTDQFHSATPFDSGGLIRPGEELDRAFQINLNPEANLEERVAYCRESTVSAPDDWRRDFARWLGYYYSDDLVGYWNRQPHPSDPEGLYSSNGNDWPAWTWEVRLSRGPTVSEAVAWLANDGYAQELRESLIGERLTPEQTNSVATLFSTCLSPIGNQHFCEELEQWAVQRCR